MTSLTIQLEEPLAEAVRQIATVQDLARCRELMSQYQDLAIGLADASVVATAERLGIQRILTVDERHFRAIQPRHLSYFILLPADV